MANDHKVSLQECTRLILLLIAFGSGIAMIAMISNSEKYGCVVLSEVKWSRCGEKNDVYCFDIAKKPSSCSYLINSQGTACFVSCLIMLFFLIQLIVKKEYNPKCSQMFTAVVSLIFTLLALVGACILTDTIRKLCKGLVESDIGLLGGPCEDYHFKNKDGDDKLYFIRPLKEAKTSSWISCCCWLFLFIIHVMKIVIKSRSENIPTNRQHQVQGKQNVDIII